MKQGNELTTIKIWKTPPGISYNKTLSPFFLYPLFSIKKTFLCISLIFLRIFCLHLTCIMYSLFIVSLLCLCFRLVVVSVNSICFKLIIELKFNKVYKTYSLLSEKKISYLCVSFSCIFIFRELKHLHTIIL